jgi:membrane associated rhomboid family serine protease
MRARLDTNAVVIMIGINLVLGFVLPGIDWHAHLGGLVAGAILGSALTPNR